MNVSDAFAELVRRIELNPARVQLASQRYNAVKGALESALPGKTVRQIGSFQRSTKIRPADLSDLLDIDAVVSFGDAMRLAPTGEGLSPEAAARQVRGALTSNERYKVMEPYVDAPTVVLEYADRPRFTIELVPAFVDRRNAVAAGRPAPYLVAAVAGWQIADYDFDAAIITQANQALGGALA